MNKFKILSGKIKPWVKKYKKLLIVVSIIIFFTVILPMGIMLSVSITSKIKCGDDGYLVGDLNNGYNCSYHIVNNEITNISQCSDSKEFCESKGKEDKNNSCNSGDVDLTNRIKYDKNRGYYIEEGPVICSYCCGITTTQN